MAKFGIRTMGNTIFTLRDQVETKDKEIDQLREKVREIEEELDTQREMYSSSVTKLRELMQVVNDSFQQLMENKSHKPVSLQMLDSLGDLQNWTHWMDRGVVHLDWMDR